MALVKLLITLFVVHFCLLDVLAQQVTTDASVETTTGATGVTGAGGTGINNAPETTTAASGAPTLHQMAPMLISAIVAAIYANFR